MAGAAASMAGLAGCDALGRGGSGSKMTPDRAASRDQMRSAWEGQVVPVAPGLDQSDVVDPAQTRTPVADALAKVDEVGDERGFGAILLPPTGVREAEPLVPSQFVHILGWGLNTSVIEFTDPSSDGLRITTLKDAQFVYLDGFTLSGGDRSQRDGGSAIHFDNDTAHPKQFNIGTLGFREWVDPVVHMERGSPFGCTWNHLDFGFGRNDGRELVLEENQGMLGTRIEYISAGNSTGDTVFSTNFAGARMFIGFLNIGGGAGQAVNVKSTETGHISIGGINFESGVSANRPIVSLVGPASFRVDYIQNGDTQMSSFVEFGNDNGNNVIGHLKNLRALDAAVRDNKIVVTRRPAAPSFYFGRRRDINHAAQRSPNKVWALGDMQAADGTRTNSVQSAPVDRYVDLSREQLDTHEFAIDEREGADTPSLVYKDDAGSLHRWDPTG